MEEIRKIELQESKLIGHQNQQELCSKPESLKRFRSPTYKLNLMESIMDTAPQVPTGRLERPLVNIELVNILTYF